MRTPNYKAEYRILLTPEVVSYLAKIHEMKGQQSLFVEAQKDALAELLEIAKIQSTEASNRIEGIITTDDRLKKIVLNKTTPKGRSEREIAGYRYVLDLIHTSHDDIPVTPGVILQLHRDLYRYQDVSFAGRWKDSDNSIVEIDEDGLRHVRFVPTSAARTPDAIASICEQYRCERERGLYDPLLLSLVFVFDLVSIHPFNDGNGRMSRLLTLLLTYQSGFHVGKYVSIEAEIEATKETYYEALAASSAGWQEGANDYRPFVTYMLGVLTACYRTLDERVAHTSFAGSNEAQLRAYFDSLAGAVSKQRMMDDNPTMSQRTLERVLQRLQADNYIEKVGAARATKYRRRQ